MATDLGKVGMVMKGAWSSSATYEVLDAVTYNNGLYIAKQAVPANTAPTNTTYWQVAVDNSGLYYKAGDSIASASYYLAGYNSANQRRYIVDIPLNKPLATGVSPSVSLTAFYYLPATTQGSVNIFSDVDSVAVTSNALGIRVTVTMKSTYTMPTATLVGLLLTCSVSFS